jgi:nicotinate-nucleotide adenylyltransferase
MSLKNRKIAIFGGTFDPVHCGHLHLAMLAQQALALDEVRFLPCRISPHKQATQPASAEERCEMLRLATADLKWATVDERELKNDATCYSYQTAESLAAEFPEAQLYWIMGGDQWLALPRWKNPERLAKCVEFIVLTRGEPILPRAGYQLHFVVGSHPAAATAIRDSIARGQPNFTWLPTDVARWIEEKKLYQR